MIITCGEWGKEILELINDANKKFLESGSSTLLIHKLFIYTNEMDEAL